MPTSSALPRLTPDHVPERTLALPAAQDAAGTPYAHARRLAEHAVADVGGTVVAEGDSSATALLMVRPIPVE
ncbi:hydroxyacid dehydrogenase, partial [Micrococcus sp. SIMBA_131]